MQRTKTRFPNGFNLPPLPEFPPGVGVPGKPITSEQFYTEDVFRMLVPDDGLRPTASPAPIQRPVPPHFSLERIDPRLERDPGYGNDAGMVKSPDGDALCQDPAQVQKIIGDYRRVEQLRDEALRELNAATDEAERAQWLEILQEREAGVQQLKPYFERAIICTKAA